MADIVRPDLLEKDLGDIEDAVGKIREAYKWAYPNAFLKPAHGHEERMSGGGFDPDPIGSIVAATDRYRRLLRHAVREVSDARNRLLGAQADLNDALALLDPKPTGPEVADIRAIPRSADKGDFKRAEQARLRREARAKTSVWGNDEVTG